MWMRVKEVGSLLRMSLRDLVEQAFAEQDRQQAERWLYSLRGCPKFGDWIGIVNDRVSDVERMVCHELWNAGFPLSTHGALRANEVRVAVRAAVKCCRDWVRDADEFERFVSEHLYDLNDISDLINTVQAPWPSWRDSLDLLRQTGFTGMTRLPARWNVGVPFLPWLSQAIYMAARGFGGGGAIELADGPNQGGGGPPFDPIAPAQTPDPLPTNSARGLARRRYRKQIEDLIAERRRGGGPPVGRENRAKAARRIRHGIENLRSLAARNSEPRDMSIPLWGKCALVVGLDGIFEELRGLTGQQAVWNHVIEYVGEWIECMTELADVIEASAR
jgi:hypothetical protein